MSLAVEKLADGESGESRFLLRAPTDLTRVGEVVETVLECCRIAGPLAARHRFRIRTVAAEAISNAINYGNRHDVARMVTVEIGVTSDHVRLGVADEGDGFDPTEVRELSLEHDCHQATSGRGLFLIRRLADQVSFNERGNTIWVTIARS